MWLTPREKLQKRGEKGYLECFNPDGFYFQSVLNVSWWLIPKCKSLHWFRRQGLLIKLQTERSVFFIRSRLGKLDEVKAECVEKCAASTVTRTQSCHCAFLWNSEMCVSYVSYQYFFRTCNIVPSYMSVGGVEDVKWKIKSRWNVKYMTDCMWFGWVETTPNDDGNRFNLLSNNPMT